MDDMVQQGFVDPTFEDEETRQPPEPEVGVDEQQLRAIVKSEIQDAINYAEEDLAEKRQSAFAAYLGEALAGDEDLDETRSRAMSRDVHDTIHAILPSVVKVFCGNSEPVEYMPVQPQDEAFADQATSYVNRVVLEQDNDYFTQFYSSAHDALVKGLGVFKWWWEETNKVEGADFTGLNEQALTLLANEPGVEITELEDYFVATESGPMRMFDCSARRTINTGGKLRVVAVPPEERIIERNARSIESCNLYGHRRTVTVSDLVEMGFDYEQCRKLAGPDELDTNEEAISRLDSAYRTQSTHADPSQAEVEIVEAYMKVDLDADGIAERYRIFCGGQSHEIMYWDDGSLAVDLHEDIPMAELCPDPVPHLATGNSISEKVADVQTIKSNLLRGMLDSLARSIFPREEVVEGAVDMDDVMSSELGAIVRVKAPGMVREITTPFMGKEAMPVLGYMDEIKANRSGVSDATMGLNPQTLQSSTHDAVEHAVSAAQTQIEMIVRHLGRGVQALFRGILRTLVANQDIPRTVKLTGNWVEVNPSLWNAEMMAVPVTARGNGTEKAKLAQLTMIADRQYAAIQQFGPQNELCTLAEYRNTLAEMVKLSGFYSPDKFWIPVNHAQQMQQILGQNQQLQQKLAELEQMGVAMQSELMKRSGAAADKDAAQALENRADALKTLVEAIQAAATTQVQPGAAQDEITAANVAQTGMQG